MRELAGFLADGPPRVGLGVNGGGNPAPRRMMARSPSVDGAGSTRDLANFLRDGPATAAALAAPMPRSESRMSHASNASWTTAETEAFAHSQRDSGISEAPLLPPPSPLPPPVANEDMPVSPSKRKRWSMLDTFKTATPPTQSTSAFPASSSRPLSDPTLPSTPEIDTPGPSVRPRAVSESVGLPTMQAARRDPDVKTPRSEVFPLDDHSAGAALAASTAGATAGAATSSSASRAEAALGSSSAAPPNATTTQITAETHPASASAPLEYVKLARTKGARMIRAVETRRKTFLAVLCGEAGERIELFTVRDAPRRARLTCAGVEERVLVAQSDVCLAVGPAHD